MLPSIFRGKISKLKNNMKALEYLIGQDRSFQSDVNVYKRIKLLFKGFSNGKYNLYNFKKNNPKNYLSDFQRRKTQIINGKYTLILDDKNIFEILLKNENVVPKTYGTIVRGKITINKEKTSFNNFIQLLKKHGTLMIKKIHGGGGKGVHRIECSNNTFYLNNEKITKNKLSTFIQNTEESIISEYLKQADYSKEIYPGTVNTIRMLTMKDPKTNEAFFAAAVHKFGSKKTEPADNVWKGGLTAKVDLETGILGAPALHRENNNEIDWIEVHPDTLVRVEGTKIPHWDNVKSSILALTNRLENIYYVGWDVVVTNDGYKIIEGNNYSDVNILQIHNPLLTDKRVREFYEHHEII